MLKQMQMVIGLFKGNLKRPTQVHQHYIKTIQRDFLLDRFTWEKSVGNWLEIQPTLRRWNGKKKSR